MRTRISKKRLQEFIDSIAIVGDSVVSSVKVYVSKVDGSYLAQVGAEHDLKYLLKKGITEQVTNCLGFNPTEQKWYGWSHRAIFGYGIGSECKKGKVHYKPENKETFLEHLKSTDKSINPHHKCTYIILPSGVSIASEFLGYPEDKSQDRFIGEVTKALYKYPEKWGKGEWTAKTLEEAKIMATDFAKGVS